MKKVDLSRKILSDNDRYAFDNIMLFSQKKAFCLNMISSPGSGKTTILARTITELKGKLKIGVIEGDIQTEIDADRIRATEAPAVQINTDGACHLTAAQVGEALKDMPIDELDLVVIENVGNLVCPSDFNLGENGKVVVLSVAEGDDKPIKYPGIFAKARALLINKVDLLAGGLVDFDIERAKVDARVLNKDIKVFPISAKTGEGFAQWCDWLADSAREL